MSLYTLKIELETTPPPAEAHEAFILTNSGGKPKWSRYVFPFSLDGFAQLGDDLYIRSGDTIKRVSEQATSDVHNGVVIPFGGTAQWSWLDFGQPGTSKMLEGFDLVASGDPSVSIGWNQTDLTAFTEPYQVPADTVPGNIIPIALTGASFSLKVDFAAGQKWEMQGASLYIHDNRPTT